MRWLHLTDLHVGSPQDAIQTNAFHELLDAIKKEIQATPLDAVFITGDLAWSGTAEEYAQLNRVILAPLRSMPSLCNKPILVVPGNHDLDCSLGVGISWDTIGESRQRDYFAESPTGQKRRSDRAKLFEAFQKACAEYELIAPRVSTEVSRSYSLASNDCRLNIILTNTAFFSDKDKPNSGIEPSPLESWRTIYQQLTPGASYNIILGHHPIDWFIAREISPVKSFLADKNVLYIHGHVHEVKSACGLNGLQQIGFGASYQDTLGGKPRPFYRNSFALCEWNNGLHVKLIHWDCENGRWVSTTTLPPEFSVQSELKVGYYYFKLSVGNDAYKALRASPPVSNFIRVDASPRKPPVIKKVRFADDLGSQQWIEQIFKWRILDIDESEQRQIRELSDNQGMGFQYIYPSLRGDGHHRIWIIPAPGCIITKTEVERSSTIYDYDDLLSFSIFTLGTLTEDGRESYIKLKRKKNLRIFTQEDLAQQLAQMLSTDVKGQLSVLDGAESMASLYVKGGHLFLIVEDERSHNWFYILNQMGERIQESNEIVRELRSYYFALKHATYGLPRGITAPKTTKINVSIFDSSQYRMSCFREFNSVKYAALAATGLRFNKITLEELYIDTRADEESSVLSEAALNRAVDDAFEGMQIDSTFRAQIKAQIRQLFRINSASTSGGTANELYQRFGAVLVLGDPGSGKTFFAKHQILAYSKPRLPWYEKHIPVYIGLAEGAQLIDWPSVKDAKSPQTIDFLEIASKLAARYGLELPRDHLEQEFQNGRLAFFFDGLDEVGALEQRSKMWEAILTLSESVQTKGNRVVITSRPAAVQVFEVPESIHSITLRGLNPSEMRVLAQRVLAARVADNGVSLGETSLSGDDDALIERLLHDCQDSRGIGRLAQNPLLFTLLIMIYANSGPPAAKRHRVYQQAVQTLVSVRNRSTGQKIFSEADLRKRLGAVALSVFRDPQGTVPSWQATVSCIRNIMEEETSSKVTDDTVEQYIRQVADATGILVLHRRTDNDAESRITFMHHSFMEYYAAVGLLSERASIEQAVSLATSPRWREVIALYSGILGESDDITPFIEKLIIGAIGDNSTNAATQKLYLAAIGYALENEVPPEATQRAIVQALDGTARSIIFYDEDFRREIGELLGRLYEASSGDLLNGFLINKLFSKDTDERSAYIEIIGHIGEQATLRDNLIERFHASYGENDTSILSSACNAISRTGQLRRTDSKDLLQRAFRRNVRTRYAAVRAVEHTPSLAKDVWRELIDATSEEQSFIALSAANAVLLAGWKIDPTDTAERADLLNALRCLFRWGQEKHVAGIGQALVVEQVSPLLDDADSQRRMLGLHLLPWVRKAEHFCHDKLIEVALSDAGHDFKVAALDSLRLSQDAQKLIKIGEIDRICQLLSTDSSEPRDVRMAAARLLGAFVRKDGRVVDILISFAKRVHRDAEEFRVAIRSLVSCSPTDKKIHAFFESEISDYLRTNRKQSDLAIRITCDLLSVAREMEWNASNNLIRMLRNVSRDFKRSSDVRGQTLVTLGAISQPSAEAALFYCEMLKKSVAGMTGYLCESVAKFTVRGRRRIEYIRELQPTLPKLAELIVQLRTSIINTGVSETMAVSIQHIRTALLEIEAMQNSYLEYAGRVLLSD